MLSLAVVHAYSLDISCSSQYVSSSENNYSVRSCIFSALSSSTSNGGAICISSSTSTVSLYSSMFYECSVSGSTANGGGLYLSIAGFSLSRACGLECSAQYEGQFIYSVSSNYTVNQMSCCQCAPVTSNHYDKTFLFNGGSQTNSRLNSSLNSVSYQYAAYSTQFATKSTVAFSNFVNCSTSNIIVSFYSVPIAIFEDSNMFGNTQTTTSLGMFFVYECPSTVLRCTFQANAGGPLFYAYDSSSSVTTIGCSISHSYPSSYSVNCSGSCALAFSTASISVSGVSCAFPRGNSDSTESFTSLQALLYLRHIFEVISLILIEQNL